MTLQHQLHGQVLQNSLALAHPRGIHQPVVVPPLETEDSYLNGVDLHSQV